MWRQHHHKRKSLLTGSYQKKLGLLVFCMIYVLCISELLLIPTSAFTGRHTVFQIADHTSTYSTQRSLQRISTSSDSKTPTPTPEPTPEPTSIKALSNTSSDNSSAEIVAPETPVAVPQQGLPGPPSGVAAVAGDKSAVVSWKPPADDGGAQILSYTVLVFLDEKNVTNQDPNANPAVKSLTLSSSSTTTSAVVGGLSNGMRYIFKVVATNSLGSSIASAASKPVTPIRPTDLCHFATCSDQGLCIPKYEADQAVCICRPGFALSPDCSTQNNASFYYWKNEPWDLCDTGCNGGYQNRPVSCWKYENGVSTREKKDSFCLQHNPRPLERYSCNLVQCGTTLARVLYAFQLAYDDISFSSTVQEQFILAFTTEVSNALGVHKERIAIARITVGYVNFDILPVTSTDEPNVDTVVEDLTKQLSIPTSKIRTMGTFAPLVVPEKVVISVEKAMQKAVDLENPAARLSLVAVFGTLIVLITFIWGFALFLRWRFVRLGYNLERRSPNYRSSPPANPVQKALPRKELRPMRVV